MQKKNPTVCLKDVKLSQVAMHLGDIEYIYKTDEGLWESRIFDQETHSQLLHNDKKSCTSNVDQLNTNIVNNNVKSRLKEMKKEIENYKNHIANTSFKIEKVLTLTQNMRNLVIQAKKENEILTNKYITEHLETEQLIIQTQLVQSLQKQMKATETKRNIKK